MLNKDFKEILSAFLSEKVEFMVVGGYAMAFHGFVRATGDIDLWIRPTKTNAKKVWRALEVFQAPLFDLKLSDLHTLGMVFQMGMIPNRIDIVTQINGVEFDESWKNHKTVKIDELEIPVIGKDQLLINKKSTERLKDRNDVLWLESEE